MAAEKIVELEAYRKAAKGGAKKKNTAPGQRTATTKAPAINDFLALREKLNTATDEKGLREKAIISILAATGMRASELCELRKSDFGTDIDGMPQVTFYRKKRKDHHTVKLSPELHSRIMEAVESYHKEAGIDADFILWSLSDFVTKKRSRLTTRSLQRIVNAWNIRDGHGKTIAPHAIRHLVGIIASREHGFVYAQKLLGHSDPKTTSRFYTEAFVKGLEF